MSKSRLWWTTNLSTSRNEPGSRRSSSRSRVGQAQALTEDVRAVTRQAGHGLERMGALTEKVGGVAEGMGRVVTVLGGLTRAGQLVGLAAGVKKGVEVFVRHLQKNEGGNHE